MPAPSAQGTGKRGRRPQQEVPEGLLEEGALQGSLRNGKCLESGGSEEQPSRRRPPRRGRQGERRAVLSVARSGDQGGAWWAETALESQAVALNATPMHGLSE